MSIPLTAVTVGEDNAGMEEVETAVETFERRYRAAQSTVVVFYRGERSFFCKQWLRRWLAIPAIERRLELAGVAILFVSSQSQGKAYSVAAQIAARRPALDARVFFFGDPEHLLAAHLGESGFAKPVITNPESHRAHGWVFDYGMVQPAVLAIASDGSVLYQWVSKPSILNVAGKLDRPDPFDVWDTIERRLDRIRITKARAARAARAAAAAVTQSVPTEPSEGPISEDLAVVKTQPSLHSLGDIHPAPPHRQDAREEKSDSELATNMSRKTSDRSIIRTKDRQPSSVKLPEVRAPTPKGDQELPLASGEVTPFLRRSGESDNNLAPLSTNIETLTTYAFSPEKALSREEPDVSDGDIASIPVKVLSSNINALASEVLAENTLSFDTSHANARHSSPGIAHRGHVERIISGPLTEDFVDEFEDVGDTKVVTDNEEGLNEIEDEAETTSSEETATSALSETTSEADGERAYDLEAEVETPDGEDGEEERHYDGIDEDNQYESFSTDEFEMDTRENEFVGSTKSTRDSRVASFVEPPTERHTSGLFASKPNSPVDNAQVSEVRSSSAPGVSFDSTEAKIPSLGSDQIETSMMTSRFGSMRTDDSAQANVYDSSGLSPVRHIVEEADDKKTGISDYLRELKGPEKRHYRVRGAIAPRSTNAQDRSFSSEVGPAKGPNPGPKTHSERKAPFEVVTEPPFKTPIVVGAEKEGVVLKSTERAVVPMPSNENDNGQGSQGRVGSSMNAKTAEKSVVPETDSPHPELHSSQRSIIDLSPFADADHNIHNPADHLTKPVPVSLRDEYEAYDEYIVCEFDVEEYVEEYDSDTTSRSRVFVTAVVDDESHATELTTDGRTVTEELPVIVAPRDTHSTGQEASGGRTERTHVRIAETAPTTIPLIDREERSHVTGKETGVSGGAIDSVRSVLRRFAIPMFSVSRFSGSRQQNAEAATAMAERTTAAAGEGEAGVSPEPDMAKISRKDTIRSVLRKKPAGTFHNVGCTPRSGTRSRVDGEDGGVGECDEHSAKLGRKETLKSVLRKIPVPKTRKRQHTGEGVSEEGNRQTMRTWTDVGENERGLPKKGGLQAVLERLPSLSGSGSRRGPVIVRNTNVRVETGSEKAASADVHEYVEADKARIRADVMNDSVQAEIGEGGRKGGAVSWGSTMVKEVRESKANGEDEGDFDTANGTENGEEEVEEIEREGREGADELRQEQGEVGEQSRAKDDGDIAWAGSGRTKQSSVAGMNWAPRARGTEEEGDVRKSGSGIGGGVFRRTLSRLRATGGTEDGNDGKEVDGAGDGVEIETGGERRIRWEKNTKGGDVDAAKETVEDSGETEQEQEKLGAKKSLAVVGGRILSRFRMS